MPSSTSTWTAPGVTNLFGGLQSMATDENREAIEKELFTCIEQVIAPLDSVPKCLLPGRHVACPASEQFARGSGCQAGQDSAGREHPAARGSQLDSQGQPIQSCGKS